MNVKQLAPAQGLGRSAAKKPAESFGWALVGALPLLIWPVMYAAGWLIGLFFPQIAQVDLQSLGTVVGWVLLLLAAGVVAALTAGWVMGFPRWVFSYLGVTLAFTLLFSMSAMPGLRLFGYTFRSNEMMGWRAWVPVFAWLAASLIITRFVRPPARFWQVVREDWSRISFGIYGLYPVALMIAFDEVRGEEQFVALLGLLLALGGYAYLREQQRKNAFLWLVGGVLVVWIAAGVYLGLYWNGRQEFGMGGPANGLHTFALILRSTANLLLLLVLPAFVAVVVRIVRSLVKKPGISGGRPT
jgi:hypothetical protein